LDVSKRIIELQRVRKYLIKLFIGFVGVPVFLGPLIFIYLESGTNSQLTDYVGSFMYNYEIITGTEITNSTTITVGGKIVTGIFSLLYLVFFGFIAAIIMTTIEIMSIREGIH